MRKRKQARKGFERKAVLFLAKFFIIYFVLQALILVLPLMWLKTGIAVLEANALGAQVQGNVILLGHGYRAEIAANCLGLLSGAMLAAVVFSLRKPDMEKKVKLTVIGAAALFVVNLFRIYAVLLAANAFNPAAAEALHTATWFAMAALVLFLWYRLTKSVAKVKAVGELI